MYFEIKLENKQIDLNTLPAINLVIGFNISNPMLDTLPLLYNGLQCYPDVMDNVSYGLSGSHIWIANKITGDRVAIVTQN